MSSASGSRRLRDSREAAASRFVRISTRKAGASRPTVEQICRAMDRNLEDYHAKLEALAKKPPARRRSFENIENEYQQNEKDLQAFFKAFRSHLVNHPQIRVAHDPHKLVVKKNAVMQKNKPIDPQDRFYRGILDKIEKHDQAQLRKQLRRLRGGLTERPQTTARIALRPPSIHNAIPEQPSESGSRFELPGAREIEPAPRPAAQPKVSESLKAFVSELRSNLFELYKDKQVVQRLCDLSPLLGLAEESEKERSIREKVEELKAKTDGIYEKFFHSRKYLQMMRNRVEQYRIETNDYVKLLPIDLSGILALLEKANSLAAHTPNTVMLTQPKDLPRPDDDAEVVFKKGVNNKFNKLNLKNINPQEKQLDDYFNKKQILNCIDRHMLIEPIREVMSEQMSPLQLVRESKPLDKDCVFTNRDQKEYLNKRYLRARGLIVAKKREGVSLPKFDFLTDPKITDRQQLPSSNRYSSLHKQLNSDRNTASRTHLPGLADDPDLLNLDVVADQLSSFNTRESEFVRRRKEEESEKDFKNGVEHFRAHQQNSESVKHYTQKLELYHQLLDRKLLKAGVRDEQDLLRLLTDNFLVDTIPDDYDGYVKKLKEKLIEKLETRYMDHTSVQTALKNLKLDERKHAERERRERELMEALKRKPISKSMNYVETMNKQTRKLDEAVRSSKGRKIKSKVATIIYNPTSPHKLSRHPHGRTPSFFGQSEEAVRRLEEKRNYFEDLNELAENIREVRKQIFQNKKQASISDIDVKSDLKFAEEILIQYRDDARNLLEEVEQIIKDHLV